MHEVFTRLITVSLSEKLQADIRAAVANAPVLVEAETEAAAILFQEFDASIQSDIARRLAKIRPVEDMYIREVERVIETKICGLFDQAEPLWPSGLKTLVDSFRKKTAFFYSHGTPP